MKRIIVVFVFLVTALCIFSQDQQSTQVEVLTLKQALALAYEQSSEFRNAQIALEKAELQWIQAQPIMQSSLQLSAQYALTDSEKTQALKSPFELSIGASVPLLPQLSLSSSYTLDGKLAVGLSYVPFKSSADLRQIQLQLDKAKLALARIKQSITQTTISYYTLVQNAAYSLHFAELQEKLAEENYSASEIEFGKGFLSYYELSSVQSNYFTAQQNSIKAHNDYMTAVYNLAVYLRADISDITIEGTIPETSRPVIRTEDQLKQLVPFEAFLGYKKDYAELLLDYKAKQDTLQPVYPDLSLQCNAQYDPVGGVVGMTLGGTIKLGLGTVTQYSYSIQKIELSQTEVTLADLYSKYKNEYAVLLKQIQQYTVACSSAYILYQNAGQNFENLGKLFGQGMANSRELLQAEIALYNSIVQYYQFYGNLRDRLTALGIFDEETTGA